MRLLVAAVVILGLCVGPAIAETVYYRAGDGSWHELEASIDDGRIRIHLGPDAVPGGSAVIVVNKPEWMVLEDTEPPALEGLTVNGASRPIVPTAINLGSLTADQAQIVLDIADDHNPIAADRLYFTLGGAHGVEVTVDTTALGPPETSGRAVISLEGLIAGSYEGTLSLADMSPLGNTRTWPVLLTMIGVSISDDTQTVALATEAGAYQFEPGLNRQLRLPNDMQLYLTGSMRGWRYPQAFTDAEIIEDTPEAKTVLIGSTDLIDNEQKPIANVQERIEYELTIRPDTPALLVRSRLINTGDGATGGSCFWGWLGGPHFVTPDGVKHEWEGVARDTYIDVGRVGWVWIAPRRDGEPGIAWFSDLMFNQTRFNTMILKSVGGGTLAPGDAVEASFAIALTDTPEQAATLYEDLLERGLLTAPPVEAE